MKETARITYLRVVLGVAGLLALFWGIGNLFLPRTMFEATAPPGEAYTNGGQVMMMLLGAYAFTWTVAAGIALQAPLRHLGLLQAVAASLGILGVVVLYLSIFVAIAPGALQWVSGILLVLLCIALIVLYPRGQKAG